MEKLETKNSIKDLIADNPMVLLYFGSNICSVCVDMNPSIENILDRYPKIKGIYIDVDKFHNIAINYSIYTIPGILLFIEGRETIREARYISIRDIDSKIDRYYDLLFH